VIRKAEKKRGEEGTLEDQIMDLLLMHPKVAFAKVNTSGVVKRKGHWITIGNIPGLADIDGMLKGGRFFCIEVKKPLEEPTKEQFDFMSMVNMGGGLAFWTDNLQDVIDTLKMETQ